MKKRFLSMLLAIVMALGMIPAAYAAPTEEAALGEIDVYNGGSELAYLSINGRVQKQKYTYYNYVSADGTVKEIPAYCVNPNLYGVPQTVAVGQSIKYIAQEKSSDPKVIGIVANGYPTRSLYELGLENKEQAYYATKMALWCHIISGWDISNLKVNPNLSGADLDRAKAILAAANDIYRRGTMWDKIYEPNYTCTPDRDTAYPVTIGGTAYKQQIFTLTSETWICNQAVNIGFADPSAVPAGTRITDMSNNDITTLTTVDVGDGSFRGQFKVLYPASAVEGQTGSAQLTIRGDVYRYGVYYASCAEKDKYGNLQNYMCDTDPTTAMALSTVSNYTDGGTDRDFDTGLRILKLESGTEKPLSGALIEIIDPYGATVGTFATDSNGEINIPLTLCGNYTVIERQSAPNHLLAGDTTQNVTVEYGKVATLTFYNDPYGSLRVQKLSDSGQYLSGVTIQAKNITTGAVYSAKTGAGGVAIFHVAPGAYEVRETAGISGWLAETETVKTVNVVTGETSTVSFTNKELPGLRILKYERGSMTVMPNVSFEIFRDNVSQGIYQTDAFGEILLTDCAEGTWRAVEVDTGDTAHILVTTPQEVELRAGDGIKDLVFFNDVKPGMWLVKVDAADPSVGIPNAVFEIKAVDGSYGPKEFRTDRNGEIDLSELPTTAMVVTEKSCPGYVIDDAQRIIQLKPNATARFVFTNRKLPSLTLTKLSSDDTPLAGVGYRLAKIEDGSHYLDRTTDGGGKIVWEGLEPGVYSLKETSTVETHILDPEEHHVELFPGKSSTVVLQNDRRPNLTIHKFDADDGSPVPDTVFTVKAVDGSTVTAVKTGIDGTATLRNLLPIAYEISEKSVPTPYLLDAPSQLITLHPNRDSDIYFENHKAPTITIVKENEITHERMANVRFRVSYKVKDSDKGDYRDLGYYTTDENGLIRLSREEHGIEDGWFKVEETDPPTGFALTDTSVQEAFVESGKSKTFTVQNRPLSALVVWKYDTVSGAALPNCWFQIRYLSGNSSGTGGTVVGTYKTSANGSFTVTGLQSGSYIVEELSSDGAHVIDTPPQSVYISGEEQSVAQLYFGNAPKGSLLVTKVSTDSKKTPLADVEFLVTTADGTLVGDANGKFKTSSTGSFLVPNVDPGTTLVVKETKAKSGYLLDDTPQTATIRAGQTVTLQFRNQPKGNLIVEKLGRKDGQTIPLAGVKFEIKFSNGQYVDAAEGRQSTNGIYYTDVSGKITISGIVGTVVVTELESVEGFSINSNTRSQTVTVNPNDTQTLRFYNNAIGGIEIIKVNIKDPQERIPNVTYEIRRLDGGLVSTVTTDSNGRAFANLSDGSYYCVETKCPWKFVLDKTHHTFEVKDGKVTSLTLTNVPNGGVEIIKVNAKDRSERIANVTFEIRRQDGALVTTVTTGSDGWTYAVLPAGAYYCVETKCPSDFVLDDTPHYFKVADGKITPLTLTNVPVGGVELIKVNAKDRSERIANVTFEIRRLDGGLVDTVTTGKNGRVYASLPDGAYYCVETNCPSDFMLDDTPHYFEVVNGKMTSLTIANVPVGGVEIIKVNAKDRSERIANVTFEIRRLDGGLVKTVTTGKTGRVYASLPDGAYYCLETDCPSGFVLDDTPHYFEVVDGRTITKAIANMPVGGLELTKVSAADKSQRIPNVTFEIHKADGAYVDTITTDKTGRVSLSLEDGDYYGIEVDCPKEYKLDSTPFYFTIKDGEIIRKTITNQPFSGILLRKVDSVSGGGIPGAVFIAYNSDHDPIGEYVSDQRGYVYINDLAVSGRCYLRELRCDGYLVDDQLKTVYVKPGETTEVIWKNIPITGQIQITKTSADYNGINGWPAGTAIPGTEFEVYNRAGVLVDTIRTDKNGVAVTKALPLGRYTLMESKAADNYLLDKTPIAVEIEFAGQIVRTAMTNKSVSTGVSVTKTGYAEVMPGQTIRYALKDIANTSNVSLNNFYWRDVLPSNAVWLDRVTTGTWNVQGSYKLVYRTNLSGSEYRTLVDNLSTAKNYTLDASPVALRLGANEYVTEVMAVFGVVPAGFRQVEQAKLDCTAVSWLTGGAQFINQADVGGIYNGAWVQATSRWVTKVYAPVKPLPRTGY